MEAGKRKQIFILLGPSGSGKTSFGKELVAHDPRDEVMFLSTGDELRDKKVLMPWQEPDMKIVKEFCYKMIDKTLETFHISTKHRILILDCVKDLDDAHYITSKAQKYGLAVTRAVLMDVDPKELEERWNERGKARDALRGSATSYFNSWLKKFNDIFNYYKKMKILSMKSWCYRPKRFLRKNKFDDATLFDSNSPVISRPNYIGYLLTDPVKARNIYLLLLSVLNVSRFDFGLPASFVHSNRDLTWVANPTRYHVTFKADGVRFLMIKVHDESYLINRKKEIYPCHIEKDELPNNTVLDGELLPSSCVSDIHPKVTALQEKNVFLTFDVLALSGQVMWKWPFTERREALGQLHISKDVAVVMKMESGDKRTTLDLKSEILHEKENNTEKLAVTVVMKEHFHSTAATILSCLSTSSNAVYLHDGLVFTPDTPYTFGPDPLLFKWQPEDLIHCDIACEDLESGKRRCISILSLNRFLSKTKTTSLEYSLYRDSGIMECQWNQKMNSWDPLFLRHDKQTPNSDETIDHVEKICRQPYTKGHLVADLSRITDIDQSEKEGMKSSSMTTICSQNHPAVNYSFDELHSLINELVLLNEVGKTTDSSTGLEIFNYYSSSSLGDPVIRLCRGLVLHPDSKTVVTKPFVRFFEDVSDRPDPQEVVEATVKFDGSLGIAFLWNNEVKVTTRRRMDSEQAMWSKQWITDHCNVNSFQMGYTYLFEIVYKVNTVIVKYPFEGLVLLAITDENGHELSYDEVFRYGRSIGFFMVTPRITGHYSEISWYCGGTVSANESSQVIRPPFISGALPTTSRRREGWVVKFKDGSRQKIVYSWWKNVSKISHLIHPQIVWLLIKHDKIENVFGNAPGHFRKEIRRMMKALARRFLLTLKEVDQSFETSKISTLEFKVSPKNLESWWTSFEDSEVSSDASSEKSELSQEPPGEESFHLQTLFESLVLRDHDHEVKHKDDYYQFVNNIESDNGHPNVQGDGENSKKNEVEGLQPAENDKEGNGTKMLELLHQLQPYRRELKESLRASPSSNLRYRAMNISPFYNEYKCNVLRLPVLDYIRPTEPVIEGYEPGKNWKQTWSKGWKTLPNDRRELVQEVLQDNHQTPPLLRMPVEVILLFLDFLDGSSLATLCKVCWVLREIVQSRQSLKEKIAMTKEQHERDVEERRKAVNVMSRSSYGYGSYIGGYGSDDYTVDSYDRGYWS